MKKREAAAICAASALIIFTVGFFVGKTLAPTRQTTVTVSASVSDNLINLPLAANGASVDNGKVNLNLASYDELCALPGISTELASRIIAYRQLHGSFAAVEELENISGISRDTVSRLYDLVSCY